MINNKLSYTTKIISIMPSYTADIYHVARFALMFEWVVQQFRPSTDGEYLFKILDFDPSKLEDGIIAIKTDYLSANQLIDIGRFAGLSNINAEYHEGEITLSCDTPELLEQAMINVSINPGIFPHSHITMCGDVHQCDEKALSTAIERFPSFSEYAERITPGLEVGEVYTVTPATQARAVEKAA